MTLGQRVELEVTTPTVRCVMTTLAQSDLGQDRSTLRTLARAWMYPSSVVRLISVYANVTRDGVVRVGEQVRIFD